MFPVRESVYCYRNRVVLLEFDYHRMPRARFSANGQAFTTWVPVGMPRINDEMLDCVFYLYRDREAAEKGENAGGTGFWVAYESDKVPNTYWIFAVSNKHVVADIGASVIRVNMRDGGVDIFEIEPHEWYFTGEDDLAIIGLSLDADKIRIHAIPLSSFVTKEAIKKHDLGPGDEVFMIGRFIKHDGKLTNIPSVRFGSFSIPASPIEHPFVGLQESFAVEMRSMAGYSGSPVFIYPSSWNMNSGSVEIAAPGVLFLLGVDWGHIVDHAEVQEKRVPTVTQSSTLPFRTVPYVQTNTGMNGVVPAWRLAQMIKKNPWTPLIIKQEEDAIAAHEVSGPTVALDSAPLAGDANPNHREDFTALLNAAAKKPQPKD